MKDLPKIINDITLPSVIYANRMLKSPSDGQGILVMSDMKFTSLSVYYPLTIVFPYKFNDFKFQAKYTSEICGKGESIEEALQNLTESVNTSVKFDYDESKEEYKSYEYWKSINDGH